MYTSNADDLVRQLSKEFDSFERRAVRFSYGMAEEFRYRIIRNIDDTFGNRAKTGGAYVKRMSARKLGASGGLRKSVAISSNGSGKFSVTVGNDQIPYAAIHEFGGEIVPRNAKFLTIPASIANGELDFFNPVTSGQRAREFDLKFEYLHYKRRGRTSLGRFLTFNSAKRQTAGRQAERNSVAYFLAKHVTMPKRPYFYPAAMSLKNDEAAIQEQMRIAGIRNNWEVRVK